MTEPSGGARALLGAVADQFSELPPTPDEPVESDEPGAGGHITNGPIGWAGYDEARERAERRTGESESVVCGIGTVGSRRAVLIAFEFGFLGGSLSERTGDRLVAAHHTARAERLPVVSLIATGGSRMQEGMRALGQLQRVARESARTCAAGLAQIAVLRDPATGGGWATLGAGSDVCLALSGAQIGFAGSRVRPADADPRAYTAESQHAHGHVDQVVSEDALPETLARWVSLLSPVSPMSPVGPVPDEPTAVEPPPALGEPALPGGGWESVTRARAPHRPRAEAYLDAYFTDRMDLSGDRCGGVDPGMRCGFGRHDGRTVAYAGQCGTANTPAGFRTAARLVRLAERLGLPVLTLVDTPGAANDADAERLGAGPAIAECFAAVAEATVPLTTLVIGEGGSGGALALAAPGNTWVTPDSYFSVIAPELAAAILKQPREDAPLLADQLRLRPQDLVELGVAVGVVSHASRR